MLSIQYPFPISLTYSSSLPGQAFSEHMVYMTFCRNYSMYASAGMLNSLCVHAIHVPPLAKHWIAVVFSKLKFQYSGLIGVLIL